MLKNNVFVNLGGLSCDCTDRVLGTIAKALSGEDGLAHDVWQLHQSPFVQSLIELFTSRGLFRLEKVKDELNAWLAGKRFAPTDDGRAAQPALPAGRLSDSELALVRIYLENLPPAEFGASDWALLIDYLVSRYMPYDALQTDAEWLAVRSTFMGKVQANIAALTVAQADGIMAALPLTIKVAAQTFNPSRAIKATLEFGRERCAENVTAVAENTRRRLKQVILDHEEQKLLGATPPASALQTKLFDEFAQLNRDWRRIALTEVATCEGNGLIGSLKPGTRVRRIEQYNGACAFCQKINGSVLTVVDPDKKDKNWDTEVWCGKSNVGRSGAKRKRVDDELVDRTDAELWKIAAGPIHPHCRGEWVVLEDARPGDDPDFAAWLDAHFAKHRKSAKQLADEHEAKREAHAAQQRAQES